MNVDRALTLILHEAHSSQHENDAHESNFPTRSLRAMRRAEREFGQKLIGPITERLEDSELEGTGARVLIGALVRLAPSRQKLYEAILSRQLPEWRRHLTGNPQEDLPSEFSIASEIAKLAEIDIPSDLSRALVKAAQSKHLGVASAALRGIQAIGDPRSLDACLDLTCRVGPALKSAALLTLGRLQAAAPNRSPEVIRFCQTTALDRGASRTERLAAFEGAFSPLTPAHAEFLSNVLGDQPLGLTKDELFLAFTLDLARAEFSTHIASMIELQGIDTLSDTLLRRIVRAKWVPAKLRVAAAERVARSLLPLRTVANESSRFGLLIQRNSSATGAFIGHCGIFVAEDSIIHCTVGSDPLAVHELSLDEWRDGLECWGIRKDRNLPEGGLTIAVDRAREIASWRTEYDGNHLNQKGEWFKGWFCSARYWEADCVGFTEHIYEHAGGNPTPNEYESGAGWPLTPREQRDAMELVFSC